MQQDKPKPPQHLSRPSQVWYTSVVGEFSLEPHHLKLLVLACEALDRGEQARIILKNSGLTTTDDQGRTRAHPCVAIERDCRIAYARLLREMDLDVSLSDARVAPPALRSNRR
jgi:phage terminase small subunit